MRMLLLDPGVRKRGRGQIGHASLWGRSSRHRRGWSAARWIPAYRDVAATCRSDSGAEWQVIGQSGPWESGHEQTAMRRLTAVQPLTVVNDRFHPQRKAASAPEPPLVLVTVLRQLVE